MAGSGTAHLRPSEEPLLSVRNLVVEFDAPHGRKVHAVSGISFDVKAGETLGIVGESGCGKTTSGRAVMQIHQATSGSIVFDGAELTELDGEELRRTRPQLQMIFQDPISSLNPRRKVRDIVREGLSIWGHRTGEFSESRVDEILEAVGLDAATVGDRRPHEFSGGQCQRICIARALVLDPKLIVCDEPVSALDVSVQAQILNLLEETKRRFGLTLVFIAHDLAVVKSISDRVLVMYLGKACEAGSADSIYASPRHPYTNALLTSIPQPDPAVPVVPGGLTGELPSALDPPSGCRFRTRCPRATDLCAETEPTMASVDDDHFVACHHPFEPDEVQVTWLPRAQSSEGPTTSSAATE
ncbi:MAG: ATP-binding cassette domain-containing protein [Acidimicrobiales bacterium]